MFVLAHKLRIKVRLRRQREALETALRVRLNRSMLDVGWVRLIERTAYKAERAGGRVVRVDARHSSNACYRCHAITPTRIGDPYRCPRCGINMDRDHNAALVITGA